MTISTSNVRVSEITRLFSIKREREKERKGKRQSSAFSFLFSLDCASHSLRSSDRTTNTTRRDFWTKCVCRTHGCCVERNAARSASPRYEDGAKTSFVWLFRGKVFRDESTHFARTNDRDLKLHFNSEMLVKQLRNQEFLPCIVRKYCFTDWNAMRCS